MQHVLKMQYISLLPQYIKLILRFFFLPVFTHAGAHLLKVSKLGLCLRLDNETNVRHSVLLEHDAASVGNRFPTF
jgi:hypothetical protein